MTEDASDDDWVASSFAAEANPCAPVIAGDDDDWVASAAVLRPMVADQGGTVTPPARTPPSPEDEWALPDVAAGAPATPPAEGPPPGPEPEAPAAGQGPGPGPRRAGRNVLPNAFREGLGEGELLTDEAMTSGIPMLCRKMFGGKKGDVNFTLSSMAAVADQIGIARSRGKDSLWASAYSGWYVLRSRLMAFTRRVIQMIEPRRNGDHRPVTQALVCVRERKYDGTRHYLSANASEEIDAGKIGTRVSGPLEVMVMESTLCFGLRKILPGGGDDKYLIFRAALPMYLQTIASPTGEQVRHSLQQLEQPFDAEVDSKFIRLVDVATKDDAASNLRAERALMRDYPSRNLVNLSCDAHKNIRCSVLGHVPLQAGRHQSDQVGAFCPWRWHAGLEEGRESDHERRTHRRPGR